MSFGYLGTAPLKPTTAISIRTLDAYRQLHRECPRLSIQAMVKSLCHIHRVRPVLFHLYRVSNNKVPQLPYARTLATQFSIAFDTYLDILHLVDARINTALSRTEPDWRLKNACAPCLHKLENEPPLKFSLLCSMDGNSSLKLVDQVIRSGEALHDNRQPRTDMWLSPEYVNLFKDEVKSRQVGVSRYSHSIQATIPWLEFKRGSSRCQG